MRKLGEGPRAEVQLGYPQTDADDAHAVAIKVFRPGTDERSVITEIEALSRAAGDHVVTLLDIAAGPHGTPAIILERLPGGSLGRLLRDRSSLRLGEAITIVVPLARALRRLHDQGIAHGAIRLEAVAFDTAGAPVLTCFGAASLFEAHLPPARLEQQSGVADDLRDFERLARAVLDRLPSPAELPAVGEEWLERVEQLLFSLGPAEAVRLEADDRADVSHPARLLTATPVPVEVSPSEPPGARQDILASLLPDWLRGDWLDSVTRLAEGASRSAVRLLSAISTVRPRVWVAISAVVVGLVAALALVPSSPPGAPAGTSAPVARTPSPEPTGAKPDFVGGDDPVAALPLLLAARERCIRDLSVLCLDAVDQMGSAALEQDQALIRSLQDGGELPAPFTAEPSQVTLEERLGDSALVSLGDVADDEPASLLMMKVEAGWRIRDFLER